MSRTDVRPDLRTLGALYEETRRRLIGVVRDAVSADAEAANAPVPACAGWRVRDVIAHLSGLATDIATGNLAGQATDAWTAAQVDTRRGLPVGDLLAESDDVGPKLASYLDDFPGRYGAQVAADMAVHEQDIRGALGRPGARDSAAVMHGVHLLLTTMVAPGARALAVPTLQITAGSRTAVVGGTGAPADPTEAIQNALATMTWPPDPEELVAPSSDAPAAARLDASPFELLRAFSGRRSLAQVHRLGWSTDPAPYDALFGLWPFTPRATDLLE